MTREEHEYEMRLLRQYRKLVESSINVAEEIRRCGGPWAGSLVVESRRALNTAEYHEQDRRRAAAEVARPVQSEQPTPIEVKS